MTSERPCPVCGATKSVKLFAKENVDQSRLSAYAYASRKLPEYMHYRLLICQACDLVFASPLPDRSVLNAAYQQAAYDSQVEAEYAAMTYARQVRSICERLPDRTAALDVGAGDGAFCRQLKSLGFTGVIGLEPSAAPIAAAKADVRDFLRQESFAPGQFPAQSFSFITCFQTIEHLPDPLEFCSEAVRLLKDGGALCLIAHNRHSLSARLLGRKSPIFDIEHLQLFSTASILRLLTNAGLKDVQARPIWNRYPIDYWTRLFPFPATLKQMLLHAEKRSGIGRIPLSVPAGNLIAWGYR